MNSSIFLSIPYQQVANTSGNDTTSDGVHVLYKNMRKTVDLNGPTQMNKGGPSTFSTSIYKDGSLRHRYHSIRSVFETGDYLGIWGAQASQEPYASLLPYHISVPVSALKDGVELVFTPYSQLMCPLSACISAFSHLYLLWNGLNASALSEEPTFLCDWGFSTSPASYMLDESGRVSGLKCQVPLLSDSPDGSLISVQVLPIFTSGRLLDQPLFLGKSLFRGELSSHHIMLRYSTSNSSCGCSPLSGLSTLVCDTCNVCGGDRSTVDCHGDCFGSAYFDSYATCTRGLTGRDPRSSAGDLLPFNFPNGEGNIFNWIAIIITISCFGFCSACCYYVTRSAVLQTEIAYRGDQQQQQQQQRIRLGPLILGRRPNRILSQGQIDLIGMFQYQQLDEDVQGLNECSICICIFQKDEACRRLPHPCDHVFHRDVRIIRAHTFVIGDQNKHLYIVHRRMVRKFKYVPRL
jgi:hypothetical protein